MATASITKVLLHVTRREGPAVVAVVVVVCVVVLSVVCDVVLHVSEAIK